MIYLDSAATSFLKPPGVKAAMMYAMDTMSSPGRGAYNAAMLAADKVYECRELACRLFNFNKPERVVFTLNATHALNIAIKSLARRETRVVISGYEHNSVTRPLHDISADVSVAAGELFDPDSVLAAFEEKIPGADLVVCNHVSNVFGFIQPVYEIAEMCRRAGVPFILDASQSAGVLEVDYQALGAAFIAMPGHKALFGPQGTGILICGVEGEPLLSGGSGTAVVYDLSGLSFSPQIKIEGDTDEDALIRKLRDLEPEFIDFILEALSRREGGAYVTADSRLY